MTGDLWGDDPVNRPTPVKFDWANKVLRRIAEYLGWQSATQPAPVEGWDLTTFVKVKPAGERVNPHGLHIVARRLDDGCERG